MTVTARAEREEVVDKLNELIERIAVQFIKRTEWEQIEDLREGVLLLLRYERNLLDQRIVKNAEPTLWDRLWAARP